jgi:hypothetical protein
MMRKSPVHWLEAIYGAAWVLAWALLLLFVTAGTAYAQLSCVPKDSSSGGTGSRIVTGKHAFGEWRYIWCPDSAAGVYADGSPKAWRLAKHATLNKYAKSAPDPLGLVIDVLNSSDPLAAINAAITGAAITPANPQELYEFKTLMYIACTDAITPPAIVDILPPPAGFCGAAPVPPSVVWVVAPNASSTTIPPTRPMWGATGAKAVTQRATVGATCNCAAPVLKGTQTLCQLVAPPGPNLAACVKQ